MVDKIAIVCGSPSTEMDAPFDDESWDIWVLGNRCDRYPRYNRIFEIHDWLGNQEEGYAEWLVDKKVPLVVGEKFPIKAPHVEKYPYRDVGLRVFDGDIYLTSSSAYMLAYAMLKYSFIEVEIAIYGVDMAVNDHEYFWQRPCMEYLIGMARGAEYKIHLPDKCPMTKSDYVEGRDWGINTDEGVFRQDEFDKMVHEHDKIIDQIREQRRALEIQQATHNGAKQTLEHLAKVARAKEAGQDISSILDAVEIRS